MTTSMRFIRMPEVSKRTGLPKGSIYDLMKKGNFPKSVSLGARTIAFVESEIQQWIDDRIHQRNEVTA